MRRTTWLVGLLMAVALQVGMAGGVATAQMGQPLTLAPLISARVVYMNTLNGSPVEVCHELDESYNRTYIVCNQFATLSLPLFGAEARAGRVVEYVFYDDRFYMRADQETTWSSAPNELYNPQADLRANITSHPAFAGPHEMVVIGSATVNGVATTQYQFWSTDKELRADVGQFKLDLFVDTGGLLHKAVLTTEIAEGTVVNTVTLTEQNRPHKVYPPDPSVVRAAGLSAFGLTAGGPSLGWR